MKLYSSKGAPNPRRVTWLMAEKGIDDIEVVELDLIKGEHRTPEYRGRVGLPVAPALEIDDGVVLTESLAICRYLESLYPEPNLFGRGALETAVVEMWTRRAEQLLATPLMLTARHSHPALAALEPNQRPEVAEFNRATGEGALKLFERQLARSPFIAADRLTVADIVAFIGLDFARLARFKVSDDFPNIQRWQDEMRARPASGA